MDGSAKSDELDQTRIRDDRFQLLPRHQTPIISRKFLIAISLTMNVPAVWLGLRNLLEYYPIDDT